MDKEPNLHVTVNDEFIDLRNHDFEDPKPVKHTNSSSRTLSRRTLSAEEQRQTVNGLRKLASTIYNTSNPPLLQRHRNIIRNRQKERAYSIDPRFRRERSPIGDKLPSQSHSESNVGSFAKSDPTKASQSVHSVRKDESDVVMRMADYNPFPQIYVDSDEKYEYKAREYVLRNKRGKRVDMGTRPTDYAILKKFYEGAENHEKKVEKTLRQKENNLVEQGTMTDECPDWEDEKIEVSKDICQSYYESALSGSNQVENIYSDITQENGTAATTPIVSDMVISNDIGPYWENKNLLKHMPHNSYEPVCPRHSKSYWTLPVSHPKQYMNDMGDSTDLYQYSNLLNTYKYDNATDIDGTSINYERAKAKLWEALWKHYYFTPFFIIGSICGLALVGTLGWMLASDFLWGYFNTQKQETWYGNCLRYVAGGIIYTVENIIRAISSMFVIPFGGH